MGSGNTSRNTSLSTTTVHRSIHKCRLKLYQAKKKPYTNMIQKQHRLLWAKALFQMDWGKVEKTVLWPDELKFILEIMNDVSSRLRRNETTFFFQKSSNWSPQLPDMLKDEGMLHSGKHWPVPTFLKTFYLFFMKQSNVLLSTFDMISMFYCEWNTCSWDLRMIDISSHLFWNGVVDIHNSKKHQNILFL